MSKSLNSVLPEEIWDPIIGMICADAAVLLEVSQDAGEFEDYVSLLTVNRAWARIALPHLYRVIVVRKASALRELACVLLHTPPTHPRRTWIRDVHVSVDEQTDEDISQFYHDVSSWMTTLFTHSCLQSFRIEEVPLQKSALATLELLHRHSLKRLQLEIWAANVSALNTISLMTSLSWLRLDFPWMGQNPFDFQSSPLHIPTVKDFTWIWRNTTTAEASLRYLALCKFNNTCNLNIDCIGPGDDPNEGGILDPLFSAHQSRSVILCCRLSATSTVLQQCQILHLRHYPDPDLWTNPRLPSFVFFSGGSVGSDGPQMDDVWKVLETLARSPHHHQTYFTFNLPGFHPRFRWKAALNPLNDPHNAGENPRAGTILQLIQYSMLLGTKGIFICDCDGNAFTGHEFRVTSPLTHAEASRLSNYE